MKLKPGKVISYFILSVALFFSMFPIFWTISTSIKARIDTFTLPPKFFNFTPTWKNYQLLFSLDGFWKIYFNTIFITLATTALCLVIGSLAAYSLARVEKFKGRSALEILMIIVRALPGIVIILPLYNLSTYFGLYDRAWALILIYTGFNIPFAIWLMTNFFDQVPTEIEDAARVDGASNLQLFTKVLIPLVTPGLVATGVFVALLSWNEFLIPIIMAGEGSKTMPILVSSFISNRTLDWGPMAAAATVALLPIVIFTIAIQKWLVVGLSGGAVKRVIDPMTSVRDRHDLVRKINQQRVMKIISEQNPIGIPQLIKFSGLSRPTVDLIVELFLENELIRESGFTQGRPGRRAALYELDPNTGFGVGVDLGGSKIACAIADVGGKILADAYEPINPQGGSLIIAQIIELIKSVAEKAGIPSEKIRQISIGTPGIISKDGKLSLGANIGNLDGMHLASILKKLFDVEVDVENDLNLAAVGEYLHGAAKEVLNFALVQLGTGIGAGIFIDGQLVRGSRGAAGEISFLPLFGNLEDPWAIENGLVESVVGTKGIIKRYESLTKSKESITVKEIFALAKTGDETAVAVVQEVGKYLGYVCASLKAVADPELIIIGGGIGSNPMLLPIVEEWANKLLPFEIKIQSTNLDVKAGVIGAAAYAAEKIRTRMMLETTERKK